MLEPPSYPITRRPALNANTLKLQGLLQKAIMVVLIAYQRVCGWLADRSRHGCMAKSTA